jgi:hypothetical protein
MIMARVRFWFSMLLVGALLLAPWQAAVAESPIQVGVVIQESDDRVQSYCVTLTEPNPTGYDALVATGLPVGAAVSLQGVGVCQIGDTGCPTGNCFCQCQGAACSYWAYSYMSDGAWLTSSVGAGGRRVSQGDVEGWRWGPGDPPSLMTFEQICADAGPASPAIEPEAPGRPIVPPGRRAAHLVPIAITVAAAALAIAASRNKRS